MTLPGAPRQPKNEGTGFDARAVMRLIPPAIIAILVLAFWIQNRNETRFDFLWLNLEARLWVLLTVSFVCGVVFTALIGWWRRPRHKKDND